MSTAGKKRRATTPDDIEKMRADIKEVFTLLNLLRGEAQACMQRDDMTPTSLAQHLGLYAPERFRAFLRGRAFFLGGEALGSIVKYVGFEADWVNTINSAVQKYGERVATVLVLGPSGIDFVCDVMACFYRHGESLSIDDFAKYFGEDGELVVELLNRRWSLMGQFIDHDLESADTGMMLPINQIEACVRILQKIQDDDSVKKYVETCLAENDKTYRRLLQEWSGTMKALGITKKRDIAERLKLSPSTISMATTEKNPYRIASLSTVLERARAVLNGSELPDESSKETAPSNEEGEEATSEEADSEPSEPVVRKESTLTSQDLRTLTVEDFNALTDLVRGQADRLTATLHLMLKSKDELALDHARRVLAPALNRLHEAIYMATSHVRIEELLELFEAESGFRRRLS